MKWKCISCKLSPREKLQHRSPRKSLSFPSKTIFHGKCLALWTEKKQNIKNKKIRLCGYKLDYRKITVLSFVVNTQQGRNFWRKASNILNRKGDLYGFCRRAMLRTSINDYGKGIYSAFSISYAVFQEN